MTMYREDTGTGTPGAARQRVEQLTKDAWGVVRREGQVWVRWPLEKTWQEWRILTADKAWAELVRRAVPAIDVPSP
jgi:hypothetical protein